MTSASIDGDTLTINFSEEIDSTVPKANNFKVKIGRKKSKVESVTVDQASDSVVLALKDPAEVTDVVTFDYKTKKKDQTTGVIQDLAGNDLQSFKGAEVTNVTAADAITGLSAKAAFPSTIAESNGEVVVDGDDLLEVNRGLGLAPNPDTDGSFFFPNAFGVDGQELIPPTSDILA